MMLIALDKAMSPRVAGLASDTAPFGAGVILRAPSGRVLFLRRSPDAPDHPGVWCWPGGGVETGESPEDAARRELHEEAGIDFSGPLRMVDDRGGFVTFMGDVSGEFRPELNDEHTDAYWTDPADLDLINADGLHPGVAATLQHLAKDGGPFCAQDATLAFDRNTVRTFDRDGRLHVATTNISKAAVNPYLGREIPDFEALGLDPDKTYRLFRDPEELAKAAATFNNLPLLSRHVPVSADDHQPDLVVGSTGSEAEFDAPYLRNSLVIWARHAIAGVEDRTKQELSSAYRYRADMTPGTYEGAAFDGVMRDIVGNHVAIVPEGRAGPDVVVGDAKPSIIRGEFIMSQKPVVLTRKAIFAQGALLASIGPKLAQDAKIDLTPVFAGITAKNFKAKSADILAGIKGATKGKLAQDASIEDVVALLATIDAIDVPEGADIDANTGLPVPALKPDDLSKDSGMEAIKAFLAGKLSDEDIAKVCAMIEEPATVDPDDVDAANDEDIKDMVTKPAMDAAISAAVKAATDKAAKTQAAIRDAERAVRPYVGDLVIAHDSAEAVYATALTTLGVKVDGVHASALPAILAAQPMPGAKTVVVNRVAMDSAATKSFHERFPGTAAIGRA